MRELYFAHHESRTDSMTDRAVYIASQMGPLSAAVGTKLAVGDKLLDSWPVSTRLMRPSPEFAVRCKFSPAEALTGASYSSGMLCPVKAEHRAFFSMNGPFGAEVSGIECGKISGKPALLSGIKADCRRRRLSPAARSIGTCYW